MPVVATYNSIIMNEITFLLSTKLIWLRWSHHATVSPKMSSIELDRIRTEGIVELCWVAIDTTLLLINAARMENTFLATKKQSSPFGTRAMDGDDRVTPRTSNMWWHLHQASGVMERSGDGTNVTQCIEMKYMCWRTMWSDVLLHKLYIWKKKFRINWKKAILKLCLRIIRPNVNRYTRRYAIQQNKCKNGE